MNLQLKQLCRFVAPSLCRCPLYEVLTFVNQTLYSFAAGIMRRKGSYPTQIGGQPT